MAGTNSARRRSSQLINMESLTREKIIGQGTFGKVWLARCKHATPVVIKEVEATTAKQQKMATTEAEVLTQLVHPHIIRLWGYAFTGSLLTLVMELADHGDVHQRIVDYRGRNLVIPEALVARWAAETAAALAYIHDLGILHRDVKPHNLLLTLTDAIKLGDFGVVRVLAEDGKAPLDRRCATPIGSPMYLPPEICNGSEYGPKADMWALGCTVFEMMALRPAFSAANLRLLLVKIKAGEPESTPFPAEYSPGLGAVVAALLVVDGGARMAASALLQMPALVPFVPNVGQWAPPPSPFDQAEFFAADPGSDLAVVAAVVNATPESPKAPALQPPATLSSRARSRASSQQTLPSFAFHAREIAPALASPPSPSSTSASASPPLSPTTASLGELRVPGSAAGSGSQRPISAEMARIRHLQHAASNRTRATSLPPPLSASLLGAVTEASAPAVSEADRAAASSPPVSPTLPQPPSPSRLLSPLSPLSSAHATRARAVRPRATSLPPPLTQLAAAHSAVTAAGRAANPSPPPLSPFSERRPPASPTSRLLLPSLDPHSPKSARASVAARNDLDPTGESARDSPASGLGQQTIDFIKVPPATSYSTSAGVNLSPGATRRVLPPVNNAG